MQLHSEITMGDLLINHRTTEQSCGMLLRRKAKGSVKKLLVYSNCKKQTNQIGCRYLDYNYIALLIIKNKS